MSSGYDHTQRGMLHYLVGLVGLACLLGAVSLGEGAAGFAVLIALAGLFMFLGACFARLRVRDCGEWLEVRFGPVEMFGTRIPYGEIASAAAGRTPLLYGWGIHGMPFFGVAYNIHGRDSVRVEFKRRRGLFRWSHIYIGTDDPEGLADFLRSKL